MRTRIAPALVCLGLFAFGASLLATPQNLLAADVDQLVTSLSDADAKVRAAAARDLAEEGSKAAPAVAALRKALSDSDPLVRAHAARALGKIGQAAMPSVDDLANMLTDENVFARREAIDALREIKPGKDRVVPLIVKALSDKDPAIVLSALHTLVEYGEDAVPLMMRLLEDDRTVYWAALALHELGPVAKDAVPGLTKALANEKEEVRQEAAMALGAIGPDAKDAVPTLTKLIDDKMVNVQNAAILALGRIGPDAKSSAAALRKAALKGDEFTQVVASWAAIKVDPENPLARAAGIAAIVRGFQSEDASVRKATLEAVGDLRPGPAVMAPIFARMVEEEDTEMIEDVKRMAISRGKEVVPNLIKALLFPKIRGHVAEILGEIGPDAAEAVPALMFALSDERPEVRAEILYALGSIGPAAKDAAPLAIKALESETPKVRYSAVYALGSFGVESDEITDALEANLGSDDPHFCTTCAWALARIDPTEEDHAENVVPLLMGAINHQRQFVRLEAIKTLGMLGKIAKSALPALKEAASDDDKEVAAAAKAAMAAIND